MYHKPNRFFLGLAACAALSAALLAGCGSEPVSQSESLPEVPSEPISQSVSSEEYERGSLYDLRLDMEPSGAIAGVMYLGYYEDEPFTDGFYAQLEESGYTNIYPFLWDLTEEQLARAEGGELYCIVPSDPESFVEVTLWDEENQVGGEELYLSEEGTPVLVMGNISDIMPNLSVTVQDHFGNVLVQYHPALSLKDGTLTQPEEGQPLVLDYTLYEEYE